MKDNATITMKSDIRMGGNRQRPDGRIWKKILVIGSCGAGKSTLARWLGTALQLQVIDIDSLLWNAEWVMTPEDEWRGKLKKLLHRDSWILEGVQPELLELGLKDCDAAMFLDVPRAVCFWRALKRIFAYARHKRSDRARRCPLWVHRQLMTWIWQYPQRVKPEVIKRLAEQAPHKPVLILRSQAELARFLSSSFGLTEQA